MIVHLCTYPVKGLRGAPVSAFLVERWGPAGDRRWMLVDGADRFVTQRQQPALATLHIAETPHGLELSAPGRPVFTVALPGPGAEIRSVRVWRDDVTARDAGDAAAGFLTEVLGTPCRLVHMADPESARTVDSDYGQAGDHVSFADGFPLLLTSSASLDDLNSRLARPVPMDRFRPNLVVDGSAPWAEDGWRRIRVGPVVFDVVKPCARCAVTTIDQSTGEKSADNEPIRTLQQFRRDSRGRVLFGQNLIPRGTGTIRLGDPVEILR